MAEKGRGAQRSRPMRIVVTSVLVDDQDKALRFYTGVLGFVKKTEIPMGEARWLTVVSPEDQDGVELVFEPDGHPAAKPFKRALVEDGIPFTSFGVNDVNAEYKRLFIQLFAAEVGMAPKLYGRVRRFQRARELVRKATEPDWAAPALACGFFD